MKHRKDQLDLFADYTPPAQQHSPTSVAAADAIAPRAETLRQAVLDYIASRGESGATDEEVQEALAMPGSTQRPRRCECADAGLIVDSGRVRRTRSGRNAVVWVAREFCHAS